MTARLSICVQVNASLRCKMLTKMVVLPKSTSVERTDIAQTGGAMFQKSRAAKAVASCRGLDVLS